MPVWSIYNKAAAIHSTTKAVSLQRVFTTKPKANHLTLNVAGSNKTFVLSGGQRNGKI